MTPPKSPIIRARNRLVLPIPEEFSMNAEVSNDHSKLTIRNAYERATRFANVAPRTVHVVEHGI